jgi:hypothetical protein
MERHYLALSPRRPGTGTVGGSAFNETVVPVLDPGRGRTKQGYFWAIARDDRPWGGSQPPAVVYSYAPGRGHIHANTLAWLNRCRRLAKDFENRTRTALAFLRLASIRLMLRKLSKSA